MKLVYVVVFTITLSTLFAQNVEFSPLSRFGIGDLSRSTNSIINNIHIIEELFTLLKSVSLIFTKSFISGPSPAKIPSLSYFVIIL